MKYKLTILHTVTGNVLRRKYSDEQANDYYVPNVKFRVRVRGTVSLDSLLSELLLHL